MTKDFVLRQFPILLPLAAEWAEQQEKIILRQGTPLSAQGMSDARLMGVACTDKVRLLKVARIPLPAHPILAAASQITGLVSSNTGGLSIRYGIFIREDYWPDRQLIAHECVHTGQYERLGGIQQFLEQYLRECVEIGYPAAPMEQEAIKKSARISD